ncbi:hypothetical protein TNCV_909471 [Trichonephila clavipes]|nr:hypothetical protein TNCV_909471 [Trichonephila clavipes]
MAPTEKIEDDNVTDYILHTHGDITGPEMVFYMENTPLTETECVNYNNSFLQADRDVTGVLLTPMSSFKVHRTSGDKDQ